MENLKEYVYLTQNNEYCIFDEYIHLEMLCRNTSFYDSDIMLKAMLTQRNETNRLIFNTYYSTKIDLIKTFFDNNYKSETVIDFIER